jgi:hypothetical protein
MEGTFRRHLVVLAIVAASAAASAAPAAASHHHAPAPGASGIGDPLFPGLGNGGYDAIHYSLALRYATAEPQQTVSGKVTMTARATQALSRFNLDFAGDSVESVKVDGRSADWTWSDEELAITPRHPLRDHEKFAATVRYTATPFVPAPGDPFPFGFFTVNGGSVTAGQPNFSHTFYPVNDHQGELRHQLRRARRHDRRRQRRPRVPPHVARAHAHVVLHARADGVRADPAGGRRL